MRSAISCGDRQYRRSSRAGRSVATSCLGATDAFSRRPLSSAYRPSIGAIFKGSSGSIVLKKSETGVPRRSCFRAHSVPCTGSCHSEAQERVVRRKNGRSAEPLKKFPSSLPAVFWIVIASEIRVFQQYRREAVIADPVRHVAAGVESGRSLRNSDQNTTVQSRFILTMVMP